MSFSKIVAAAFAGGVLIFAGAPSVSAHASIPSDELNAGGYGHISIRIPHGCEGEPTNIVEVQIPDGFTAIKPQAKPGWVVATETVALAEPVEMHGSSITERVGVIRWSGGALADDQFDDFGITLKVPDAAGTTAEFPTVQYCGELSVSWVGDDVPSVKILNGGGGGHGSSITMDAEDVLADAVREAVAIEVTKQSVSLEAMADQIESLRTAEAEAVSTPNSGSDPLAVTAVVLSSAGLAAGAAALVGMRRARRKN